MGIVMSEEKKEKKVEVTIYTVKCSRCQHLIKLSKPPKTTGFLCNNCWLKWKEIQRKMIGKTYSDEVNKAFIRFVNTAPWT